MLAAPSDTHNAQEETMSEDKLRFTKGQKSGSRWCPRGVMDKERPGEEDRRMEDDQEDSVEAPCFPA